mmetsp:Transcript_47250/g.101719  ORF Transcript_47250/g.101719 Transcript_47250/m.101719 type:complete len:450 (+) Transcript_47250:241-1590(+)
MSCSTSFNSFSRSSARCRCPGVSKRSGSWRCCDSKSSKRRRSRNSVSFRWLSASSTQPGGTPGASFLRPSFSAMSFSSAAISALIRCKYLGTPEESLERGRAAPLAIIGVPPARFNGGLPAQALAVVDGGRDPAGPPPSASTTSWLGARAGGRPGRVLLGCAIAASEPLTPLLALLLIALMGLDAPSLLLLLLQRRAPSRCSAEASPCRWSSLEAPWLALRGQAGTLSSPAAAAAAAAAKPEAAAEAAEGGSFDLETAVASLWRASGASASAAARADSGRLLGYPPLPMLGRGGARVGVGIARGGYPPARAGGCGCFALSSLFIAPGPGACIRQRGAVRKAPEMRRPRLPAEEERGGCAARASTASGGRPASDWCSPPPAAAMAAEIPTREGSTRIAPRGTFGGASGWGWRIRAPTEPSSARRAFRMHSCCAGVSMRGVPEPEVAMAAG